MEQLEKTQVESQPHPELGMLFVKRLTDTAIMPSKEREEDEGYDIFADEDITIPNATTQRVSTGISAFATDIQVVTDPVTGKTWEVKNGNCWLQIEGRSGLAYKGIFPIGGVLDSGYVGEIGVLLANLTGADYTITQGDKIAQLVIREHISMPIEEVTELPDSDRGSKGFGSSGK